AAPTEQEAAAPEASAVGDLGEISDPAVLRERLATRSAPPATSADEPGGFEEREDAAAAGALAPACVATLESNAAATPELVATATYQGAAALVVVADADGAKAFVLDQATCGLLSTVPLV
ncbi:MAG: hypothetical protein ACRDY6_06455, partial [Acidimicrobiia bacterium]